MITYYNIQYHMVPNMQYAPQHIYDAIQLHTITYYEFKHITLVKFTKMNDVILFSTITRTA